jgi:transcriptional regulator with PAS, ATPase and Fis domain
VKLLRVLQEGEIEKVGDFKKIKVNVRIICATHRDIPLEVEKGKFRLDLYFRIGVIPIRLPPLRERRGDIALLAHNFLLNFNKRYGKNKFFDSETIDVLSKHTWSGNVRELENAIQYAAIISTDDQITPEFLPEIITKKDFHVSKNEFAEYKIEDMKLEKAIQDLEAKIIIEAFRRVKTQDEVATLVGISRGSLQYKIKNNQDILHFLIKNNLK